jgi:hypothetical protein
MVLRREYFFLEVGALLAFTLFVTACEQRRMPDCLVFPQGFVGWVSVEYNVTEAAPLPVKDGCVWIDFRTDQTIRTNSKILIGWARIDTSKTQEKGWRRFTRRSPKNERFRTTFIFSNPRPPT